MPTLRSPKPPTLPAWTRFAVPLLLALVASVHIGLVHAGKLNPWVGGGFGMFAQVDRREHRVVRAYVDLDGRPVALDVYEFSERSRRNLQLVRQASALPTRRALRGLSSALADQEWTSAGEPWDRPSPAARRPATLDGVRVEVHRLRYESGKARAKPELLAAVGVAP